MSAPGDATNYPDTAAALLRVPTTPEYFARRIGLSDNFKLVIEYDGSRYHGWQRQSKHRSIQGEIESALSTMTRQRLTLIGSGRTDAGVHAKGQIANFKCTTRISPQEFQRGLNSLLPEDIVIRNCSHAAPDFHARFGVKSKTYHYTIFNSPRPVAIGRQYHWWIAGALDAAAMQAATPFLQGRHDFKAFEGTGSPRAHTIRQVLAADVTISDPPWIRLSIQADGFLRFMVRNIMGTLVEIGRGKHFPEQMRSIIDSRDRQQAGATAPPQGLCLIQVNY